jgi:flagellar basal body-associated protein FliL
MSSKKNRDNIVLYTVASASLVLFAGFGGAWFYLKHMDKLRSQAFFSKPAPVVTIAGDHSVAATFAVRTTGADATWVQANSHALEQIVKSALTEADMNTVRTPQGLRALQGSLRDAVNAALQTTKVQEVLITDFLVGDTSG